MQHDVILVGGGGAGLRAAIAVAERNPELSVAVVSKVYPMRSHTVSAEGGAAAVIKDNDTLDDHAYDTISGSDWLADQDAVDALVTDAPRELLQLEHWGCPWSREPDGHIAVRPFGGMRNERTWFAADKTGFHMLHTLFQRSLKYSAVVRYDEWFVSELAVADGRCQGVVAIEIATGEVHAIAAGAVIMCTGGAGRIFPFTTNAAIKTGDGMALAYRAGVPLKDMEFVQYHPTGLPFTGILITEACRGEGGVLLNRHGHRYLQDYDLGEPLEVSDRDHPQKRTMELGPRDRLSQAFWHEARKGNTVETEHGPVLQLDIRHLGEERIDRKLPFVRELCRKYVGIDPVHELIPVRAVVHYMMGGIDTDLRGATSLPGLFAAGECACVSVNGANRLGSNSLTELMVFGARAGHNAAIFAAVDRGIDELSLVDAVERTRERIRCFSSSAEGGDSVAELRREMHAAMEDGAGIYRDALSMRRACEAISSLKVRYLSAHVSDTTRSFNTEIINLLELGFQLDAAEAVAYCGMSRCESRGSHQRVDYPKRDDINFLRHSLAYRTDGTPRIEYRDVVIGRWPPAVRSYGGPATEAHMDPPEVRNAS